MAKKDMNNLADNNKVIDFLIDIIKNQNNEIDLDFIKDNEDNKNAFIINLYLFKLIINNDYYLIDKYNNYKYTILDAQDINLKKITNMKVESEIELLLEVRDKLIHVPFIYNDEEKLIYFEDDTWIDSYWLITLIILILDKPVSGSDNNNSLNFYYAIPTKDIKRYQEEDSILDFINYFKFYNISIESKDPKCKLKSSIISSLKKNITDYIKHFKQYEYGVDKESHKSFYFILQNEAKKYGFEVNHNRIDFEDFDDDQIETIYSLFNDKFTKQSINKQVSLLEDKIWQLSNNYFTLKRSNNYIDATLDFLTIIKFNKNASYEKLKEKYKMKDIKILLCLATNKFFNTFYGNENFDYSKLDFNSLRPKYMDSLIKKEDRIKRNEIKELELELNHNQEKLKYYRKEKDNLDKSNENYISVLESCLNKINKASLNIDKIQNRLEELKKDYEKYKEELIKNCTNFDKYIYNYSMISHICNSIINNNFYVKRKSTYDIFESVLVFEDNDRMHNTFYLEISLYNLLKLTDIER